MQLAHFHLHSFFTKKFTIIFYTAFLELRFVIPINLILNAYFILITFNLTFHHFLSEYIKIMILNPTKNEHNMSILVNKCKNISFKKEYKFNINTTKQEYKSSTRFSNNGGMKLKCLFDNSFF